MAQAKISQLWKNPLQPCLSSQVLKEFYVNLIRKQKSQKEAQKTIEDFSHWFVVEEDKELIAQGLVFHKKFQLSAWDSWILAAAKKARAQVIWSEDFSDNRDYEGIRVVNPLKKAL